MIVGFDLKSKGTPGGVPSPRGGAHAGNGSFFNFYRSSPPVQLFDKYMLKKSQ